MDKLPICLSTLARRISAINSITGGRAGIFSIAFKGPQKENFFWDYGFCGSHKFQAMTLKKTSHFGLQGYKLSTLSVPTWGRCFQFDC